MWAVLAVGTLAYVLVRRAGADEEPQRNISAAEYTLIKPASYGDIAVFSAEPVDYVRGRRTKLRNCGSTVRRDRWWKKG